MPKPIAAGMVFTDDIKGSQLYPDGMQIARNSPMFSFLPALDTKGKTPRQIVDVIDEAGQEWTFAFICHRVGSTREDLYEYRLTGMMGFIREFNLKAGDIIHFRKSGRETFVNYFRASKFHPRVATPVSVFPLEDAAETWWPSRFEDSGIHTKNPARSDARHRLEGCSI